MWPATWATPSRGGSRCSPRSCAPTRSTRCTGAPTRRPQRSSSQLPPDLLRTMWRIRAFEERVVQLKRADEVHGLIHLSVGQEGVAAGVCTQLRDDDPVYSGHRAHGHAIAKGAPLDR